MSVAPTDFSYPKHPGWEAFGGKHVTGTRPSKDSAARGDLWWQGFIPESGTPSAVAVFAHGIHEHAQRYNHLMQGLVVESGGRIAAFSMDHCNHGMSAPKGSVVHRDTFHPLKASLMTGKHLFALRETTLRTRIFQYLCLGNRSGRW